MPWFLLPGGSGLPPLPKPLLPALDCAKAVISCSGYRRRLCHLPRARFRLPARIGLVGGAGFSLGSGPRFFRSPQILLLFSPSPSRPRWLPARPALPPLLWPSHRPRCGSRLPGLHCFPRWCASVFVLNPGDATIANGPPSAASGLSADFVSGPDPTDGSARSAFFFPGNTKFRIDRAVRDLVPWGLFGPLDCHGCHARRAGFRWTYSIRSADDSNAENVGETPAFARWVLPAKFVREQRAVTR